MRVTVVRRVGKCRRCGKCCRWFFCMTIWESSPLAPMDKGRSFVVNSRRDVVPVMKRLGFVVLAISEIVSGKRDWKAWRLKLECGNLGENGCAIHERKPYFCQSYPVNSNSRRFKGCGFGWKKTRVKR